MVTAATELCAGVDLSDTSITCAFADSAGETAASATVPIDLGEGPDVVLERVVSLIDKLALDCGYGPAAVGIGVPGQVDMATGTTGGSSRLPAAWRGVPVRAILRSAVGCPSFVLNRFHMAAVGEMAFGHGQDARTMAFLSVGTEIGGAIVIDGKLRLGPSGAAGGIGHQTIVVGGARCRCGNRGCLETLASGPAISAAGVRLLRSGLAPRLQELTAGDERKVTPETMATASEEGDADVRECIFQAATFLGIGVANVVTLLHPDLVVIGGAVARMGGVLFGTVRATVRESVRSFPVDDVRILPTQLGERAGVLGAVTWAKGQMTDRG